VPDQHDLAQLAILDLADDVVDVVLDGDGFERLRVPTRAMPREVDGDDGIDATVGTQERHEAIPAPGTVRATVDQYEARQSDLQAGSALFPRSSPR